MSENQNINWQYVLAIFGSVVFTWELHEFFHWLAGELLGNKMVMTLNTCYPVSGMYLKGWHEHVVSAAGPAVTVMEAVLVFILLKRDKSLLLFPFLLTCFYSRFMAGAMNVFHPNDEGRLSLALGADVFFISLLVVGILSLFVYRIVKVRGIQTKLIVTITIWIVLVSSMLILGDQFFQVVILR